MALTGAGLSTESGIPDYRSPEALARSRRPITRTGVRTVRGVRRAVLGALGARLGAGYDPSRPTERGAPRPSRHSSRRCGAVRAVITQNVDRLHHRGRQPQNHGAAWRAGRREVPLVRQLLEDRDALQTRLLARNPGWTSAERRERPGRRNAEVHADAIDSFDVPACAKWRRQCSSSRVVFFGDSVPRATVDLAFAAVETAELLLVVGSSLAVYSGYRRFLRRAVDCGIPIAIVNRGPVRGEEHAVLKVEASTGTTLDALANALMPRD